MASPLVAVVRATRLHAISCSASTSKNSTSKNSTAVFDAGTSNLFQDPGAYGGELLLGSPGAFARSNTSISGGYKDEQQGERCLDGKGRDKLTCVEKQEGGPDDDPEAEDEEEAALEDPEAKEEAAVEDALDASISRSRRSGGECCCCDLERIYGCRRPGVEMRLPATWSRDEAAGDLE